MQNRVAKYNIGFGVENRQYYFRDAQGNVMATYKLWKHTSGGVTYLDSVKLMEQHIYGSARVGMVAPELKLYPVVPTNPHALDSCHYRIFEGWKRYEIANHLGNVLAVITDRKRGQGSSGDIEWFAADVLATQQYYPFGMLMPADTSANVRRQYSLNTYDYRYGFNGKEGDDEVKGDDNQQDYGMRIYDPRVGRFLSVDPLIASFPSWSSYPFAMNRPIDGVDLDGEEWDYSMEGNQYKIRVGIDLRIDDTALDIIKKEEIEALKIAINDQFNRTLQISSLNNSFSGNAYFSPEDTKQLVPFLSIIAKQFPEGSKDYIVVSGDTWMGGSSINIYRKDNTRHTIEALAQTAVHEIFHTLRLEHPTDYTLTNDTELIHLTDSDGKLLNEYITTPKTDQNINYNLMIYDFYYINGESLNKARENKSAEYLTPGQLDYLLKEIDFHKQHPEQTGFGSSYWFPTEDLSSKELKTQKKE